MAGQSHAQYEEPGGRLPAPGRLALLQDFANAHFAEQPQPDRERLMEPLGAWAVRRGLMRRGQRLSEPEVARLLELRASLRAAMETNNDGRPMDRATVRRLNELASRGQLSVEFSADAAPSLAPSLATPSGIVSQLLAIVVDSAARGTWQRLKICRADDCRWAFYDHSKNRRGAWCSMNECGNRAKARAFRARHRTTFRASKRSRL
jgi:predicted RNA-binding Zn ribbon-like protein